LQNFPTVSHHNSNERLNGDGVDAWMSVCNSPPSPLRSPPLVTPSSSYQFVHENVVNSVASCNNQYNHQSYYHPQVGVGGGGNGMKQRSSSRLSPPSFSKEVAYNKDDNNNNAHLHQQHVTYLPTPSSPNNSQLSPPYSNHNNNHNNTLTSPLFGNFNVSSSSGGENANVPQFAALSCESEQRRRKSQHSRHQMNMQQHPSQEQPQSSAVGLLRQQQREITLYKKRNNNFSARNRQQQRDKSQVFLIIVVGLLFCCCVLVIFFAFNINHHITISSNSIVSKTLASPKTNNILTHPTKGDDDDDYTPLQVTTSNTTSTYVSSDVPTKRNLELFQFLPAISLPLTNHDRSYYTIRMNTYKRNEQLQISINHHAKCPGVAKIVVVWCDKVNQPPKRIKNHESGKVEIEYHELNTLNERYRIMNESTKTRGVLSLDDDLLRPCEALDAGFFRWTRSPERIVGFDARVHTIHNDDHKDSIGNGSKHDVWSYGFLSTTKKENKYSTILMRSAFIHRDYLNLYMQYVPRIIFDTVSTEFNCEDIAMSFFVSALTDGLVPLLADKFAVRSMVKLYDPEGISKTTEHKKKRDECVNNFAIELGLKGESGSGGTNTLTKEDPDTISKLYVNKGSNIQSIQRLKSHKLDPGIKSLFFWGAMQSANERPSLSYAPHVEPANMVEREQDLRELVSTWTMSNVGSKKKKIMKETSQEALLHGLIENTEQWKERWGGGNEKEEKHTEEKVKLPKKKKKKNKS